MVPHRRHRSGKWLSLRAENTFGAVHARVGQPHHGRLQRGLRAGVQGLMHRDGGGE